MGALHDLVKAGKIRYIGASSMYAHQFAQMRTLPSIWITIFNRIRCGKEQLYQVCIHAKLVQHVVP